MSNTINKKSGVAARVAAGILWLDTEEPGWRDRIDLEKLDLYSIDNCVLAQVYKHKENKFWGYRTNRGFNYGFELLEKKFGCVGSAQHGFSAYGDEEDFDELFKELNEEWKLQLKASPSILDSAGISREVVYG